MTANQARAAIIAGFAVLAGLAYLADEGHVWAKVVVAVICLPILVWLLAAIGIGAIQAISRRRAHAKSTAIQPLSFGVYEDGEPITFLYGEDGEAR